MAGNSDCWICCSEADVDKKHINTRYCSSLSPGRVQPGKEQSEKAWQMFTFPWAAAEERGRGSLCAVELWVGECKDVDECSPNRGRKNLLHNYRFLVDTGHTRPPRTEVPSHVAAMFFLLTDTQVTQLKHKGRAFISRSGKPGGGWAANATGPRGSHRRTGGPCLPPNLILRASVETTDNLRRRWGELAGSVPATGPDRPWEGCDRHTPGTSLRRSNPAVPVCPFLSQRRLGS